MGNKTKKLKSSAKANAYLKAAIRRYKNAIKTGKIKVDIYDREETVWKTQYGKEILIKDIPDKHLANIIDMMKNDSYRKTTKMYEFLLGEAKHRKLSKAFLAGAQYVHTDSDGDKAIWNYEKSKSIKLGKDLELYKTLFKR